MSGSEPIWADHDRGGGWWSSPSGVPIRPALSHRRRAATGYFSTRLGGVRGIHNDGSLARAEEIAAWVLSNGGGRETAYVEQLALGNWGVVVLRPERPDALWVLTD